MCSFVELKTKLEENTTTCLSSHQKERNQSARKIS